MPERIAAETVSSFWGYLTLYIGAFLAWAGGDTARTALAGSAGGLVRWLLRDGRSVRDGLISVGAGAVFAIYISPGVRAVFEKFVGPLADGSGTDHFAAFSSGLVGMALAKVAIATIENHGERQRGGRNHRPNRDRGDDDADAN